MRFFPSVHVITVHAPFPLLTEHDSHQESPQKTKIPPRNKTIPGVVFVLSVVK